MKRKLALLMVSVLSVVSLAACGNTASPMGSSETETSKTAGTEMTSAVTTSEAQSSVSAKGVTIQFWNSFTGSDGDILREIVDQYNKENQDGITINMDIMPGETLSEKLAPAITTGTAPDGAIAADRNRGQGLPG